MYRDINNVAPLINYSYHLLIGLLALIVTTRWQWHPHKASKLAYSEVNMHKKIARLKLLQLFESECYLAVSGFFRLQVELMEAVEHLMIGEKTHLQAVVGKPFMNGEWCRLDVYRQFVVIVLTPYQFFHPLYLFGTVGHNTEAIALRVVAGNRLSEQFNVFMKEWLG